MFIDSNNKVDREGLRVYVLAHLTVLKQLATVNCMDKQTFWDKTQVYAKKSLFGKDADAVTAAIQQLTHLPYYIQLWIDTAVDTSERFDFFVMTKAHEMKSGDQERDYFWALMVRHDQLMGLVRVLEVLLEQVKNWVLETPKKLLDNPVFLGLLEVGIEEQVYLEAEKVYKERQTVGDV